MSDNSEAKELDEETTVDRQVFLETSDNAQDEDLEFNELVDGSLSDESILVPTAASLIDLQQYLRRLNLQILTVEEEQEYVTRAQNGDEQARNHLIQCHMRVIIGIAKRYAWVKSMEFSDLISEGVLGMIRAIEKYKLKLGFRLVTYASWWIRQCIERAIMCKERLVRLPVYVIQDRRAYFRALQVLKRQLHRDPTDQEIAEFTKKDLEWVSSMHNLASDGSLSLDEKINQDSNGDENTSFMDYLEDAEQLNPEQQVVQDNFMDAIDSLIATLPEEQAAVLILRFGLQNSEPHTVNDVAKQLNLSVSEVKRRQLSAIRFLRKKLQEYQAI